MRTSRTLIIFFLLPAILFSNHTLAQPPAEVVDHFKMTVFCKKKADITHSEFKDWVLNTHVPMVEKFPKIRGYVQNFVLEKTEDFPYDLVVELWFDSEEDHTAAMQSELGQQAVADVPNGIEAMKSMAVYEVPITDAPMPEARRQKQFKALWVANHNSDLDFRDYQLGQLMTYSPLAKRFPGMNGYLLNFATSPDDPDKVYSLVVSTWFDSQKAMMDSFSAKADNMAKLKKKQEVLLARPAVMIPVEEYVMVQPPSYVRQLTK